MLISFYFSYKSFISNDIIKYKNRLEKLLIPYIFWPVIFLSISEFPFDSSSINIKKLIFKIINYLFLFIKSGGVLIITNIQLITKFFLHIHLIYKYFHILQ